MSLEKEFEAAMYKLAGDIQEEFHITPSRFLQLLSRKGGVGTAKYLLAPDEPQSGFTTLWESGRYDLSVEYHVIMEKWRPLFTEEERQKAINRLRENGWKGIDSTS